MKRLASRIAFEIAVRFARERLTNIAAGGYQIGWREGYQARQRDSLRGFFPRATDALDAVLDKERQN